MARSTARCVGPSAPTTRSATLPLVASHPRSSDAAQASARASLALESSGCMADMTAGSRRIRWRAMIRRLPDSCTGRSAKSWQTVYQNNIRRTGEWSAIKLVNFRILIIVQGVEYSLTLSEAKDKFKLGEAITSSQTKQRVCSSIWIGRYLSIALLDPCCC